MDKEYLFNEIQRFMIKVKKDFQDNIITKVQYELMHIELSHLIESICNTELLISITKFDAIKTTYIIMK